MPAGRRVAAITPSVAPPLTPTHAAGHPCELDEAGRSTAFDDAVDLLVEIHGVFAPPVSRANDAVNPPTGRAERCLGDRERLGSDPDAVHEHDVGAVIGVRKRTHVGEVVEMFRSARRADDPVDEEVHLLDVGIGRCLALCPHGVAVLVDDRAREG